METVLLTTCEKLDDFVDGTYTSSRTHAAVKFGEFYLAAGLGFGDYLSDSTVDMTSVAITRELRESKFQALISTSKGLSRDFELRPVYVAAVHRCAAIKSTLNKELDTVSFGNTIVRNPGLLDTFILFR